MGNTNNLDTEVVLVTSALAKEWLTHNPANRNVHPNVVLKYSNDMRRGNWRLTGEPIKFDSDGTLLDGQHRLLAVINSGTSVHFLVVRGVEPEARFVMDTGSVRKAADALTIEGYSHTALLAATARLALRYKAMPASAGRLPTMPVSNSDIRDFIDQHPHLIEAVLFTRHYQTDILVPPSVLAMAHWLFAGRDRGEAEAFVRALAEHNTSGQGDPRSALLKRLAMLRVDSSRGRVAVDQSVYLALMIRAWNGVRTGERLASIPSTIRITKKVV
jgi:hypothetical protein